MSLLALITMGMVRDCLDFSDGGRPAGSLAEVGNTAEASMRHGQSAASRPTHIVQFHNRHMPAGRHMAGEGRLAAK